MWQIMEELAHQRERDIVASTRSLLVTHHPATELSTRRAWSARRNRAETGRTQLPPLSFAKWRQWATRGRGEVHCNRASAMGAC